ncbi:capsule biosynthesis protein [Microbulbifer sp. JMSA004]|uniref:capsule biosynthesis protein n=1 Tax=Microbulbifer sp. JMSA004 TaxID=3243370 RepID=UPI004039BF92
MSVAVFLQGPHGPFFAQLARRLSQSGVITHKINFNGGDRYFAWADFQVDFTGGESDWSAFFSDYLSKNNVDTVFCYGDCRRLHTIAKSICESKDIAFGVFEEGYLRPDFITLEFGGVNAHSRTDWSREAINSYRARERKPVKSVGQTFFRRARFAMAYYLAMRVSQSEFPHYRHHRSLSWLGEGVCWIRSFYRKGLYKLMERGLTARLTGELSGRYFLFPLQTRDDFQLRKHSDLVSIENAIEVVLQSFAQNAPQDSMMVIKHHPMDRGFCHYQKLIRELETRYQITGRVIYCHDLHLPTLLDHTLGVVTINSTVGISALFHEVPTQVLGRSLYDLPGLTHQGGLSSFWNQSDPVDTEFFQRFRAYLYDKTQVDGSFSRHITATIDGVCRRLTEARATELRQQPETEVDMV